MGNRVLRGVSISICPGGSGNGGSPSSGFKVKVLALEEW